jgi:hypothetical protein
MDELGKKLRAMRAVPNPSPSMRAEMRRLEAQHRAARRNVDQMRDGLR